MVMIDLVRREMANFARFSFRGMRATGILYLVEGKGSQGSRIHSTAYRTC